MSQLSRDLRKFLNVPDVREMIIGTVVEVTEEGGDEKRSFFCTVKPEKSTEAEIPNVPLRVMTYDNNLGIIIVPKKDTEVLVGWVDRRPTIIACQEWEKIIVHQKKQPDQKEPKFYLELTKEYGLKFDISGEVEGKAVKKISIETKADATVKADMNINAEAGMTLTAKAKTLVTIDAAIIKIGRGMMPVLTADVVCPFTKAPHIPVQTKTLA